MSAFSTSASDARRTVCFPLNMMWLCRLSTGSASDQTIKGDFRGRDEMHVAEYSNSINDQRRGMA